MNCFMFLYEWNSRDLKRIILSILKSWVVDNVYKLNYVQKFSIVDKIVNKSEEKILLVYTKDEGKLMDFLSKNFPQLLRVYVK